MERLLICKEDFDCIGQVAKHCDWDNLCMYIREQQNLSLLPKIGHCLFDKISKFVQGYATHEESVILNHLWNGGTYTACEGTIKSHFGIKRSLVHWAYGAYIYRGGAVNTPFGTVQKVHNDSIPVSMNDLKNLNIEHRSNAEHYWKLTKDFLCSVKDCEEIEDCRICDCVNDCRCDSCKHGGKSTLQRRGVKMSNVSKFD